MSACRASPAQRRTGTRCRVPARLVVVLRALLRQQPPRHHAGLLQGSLTLCQPVLQQSPLTTIRGDRVALSDYSDRVTLVVNAASRCGLTPQYAQLEDLQRTYGSRGFAVLGFPSDDFEQEPGSREEIETFCSMT
ncbi:hypothetical protein [uncultured Cellulomonas sp.]|uniref:hypothetical protein n=1 Tax=uncultured Cellulomonas sp. TaxID=189682 RepID=UPI00345BF9F9